MTYGSHTQLQHVGIGNHVRTRQRLRQATGQPTNLRTTYREEGFRKPTPDRIHPGRSFIHSHCIAWIRNSLHMIRNEFIFIMNCTSACVYVCEREKEIRMKERVIKYMNQLPFQLPFGKDFFVSLPFYLFRIDRQKKPSAVCLFVLLY